MLGSNHRMGQVSKIPKHLTYIYECIYKRVLHIILSVMIFDTIHSVDGITIPSKKGKGVLRRVSEVFDCWFESGRYDTTLSHFKTLFQDEL